MPDLKTQARELVSAVSQGRMVAAIHYGCGNLNESRDAPVPVTCIAVSIMEPTAQDVHLSIASAPHHEDVVEREKYLLERFYSYMSTIPFAHLVHWNMNKSNYSLAAISARYEYLFNSKPPSVIAADRLIDLDELVADRYGSYYAPHPKLRGPMFDQRVAHAALQVGSRGG